MSTNTSKSPEKSEGTSTEFKILLCIIGAGVVAVIIKMIM